MATASQISQKEYLKRYLSNDKDDKKKKKKRKEVSSSVALKRSQIIDDDIDLKNMRVLDDDEIELYQLDEDAPQIAGIIDERPPEVQAMEYYGNTKRWKVFGGDNDDGELLVKDNLEKSNSDTLKEKKLKSLDISKIDGNDLKSISKLIKEKQISRVPISHLEPQNRRKKDNNYSDITSKRVQKKSSKKSRNDSDNDSSPPHFQHKHGSSKKISNQRSDNSDFSPPRKKNSSAKTKSDSDDSDLSPPRKKDNKSQRKIRKYSSSSDLSPPRIKDKTSSRKSRKHSDSDLSPPRKSNKCRKSESYSDSDLSPPRRSNKDHNRFKHSKDSDFSPPRKDKKYSSCSSKNHERSDSDLSPPRKKTSDKYDYRKNNKYNFDSKSNDIKRSRSESRNCDYKSRHKNDSSEPFDSRKRRKEGIRDQDLEDSKRNKMGKTLEGKQAGLQNAKQLKQELLEFKSREDQMFSKLSSDVSGKGAATVMRDRKTGLIRDLEKERAAELKKAEKNAEQNEKYAKWGRGLKQVEDAAERFANAVHEMSKPLARYADDDDLDKFLKAQEREGDPMLDYIRKKQSESIPLNESKPVYKGSFLPNRFGIRPGYRWDGVDRSSGYEKQWFTTQNNRKARDEEAYKWSVSDM